MFEEPSSADPDPTDDYIWEEHPELGKIPVARRDSGYAASAAASTTSSIAADQGSSKAARFDSFVDEDDKFYDPLYVQARQDRDDLLAQSMETAPQYYMPIDLIPKAHANRGGFDPTGNFKDVKLSDSELPNGATVRKRKIKRFKNGDVEITESDGSKELTRAADGLNVWTSADGTVTEETLEQKAARDSEQAALQKRHQRARRLGSYKMLKELPPLKTTMLDEEKEGAVLARRVRGRMTGPSLPSNRARRDAEASNAVPDEYPDVLMFGGFNVLPEIQRELGQFARKGEMNMRPGSEKLLHDERELSAPAYLKHFAGASLGADWSAEHPDDLLEQEDREWRANQKRKRMEERERNDTRSEAEKLVTKYKIRKNMDVTGEIMEEDAEEQLAKMRENQREIEAIRAELARREEEKRREEEELEKQLMKAMNDAVQEPGEEAVDGYDSDIENREYPDPVPSYLLDRREHYLLKPKTKPHKRKQPALGERSANPLAIHNPVYTWPRFGPAAYDDADSDCEIVDAPPDKADRMVEA
jgi:hypothetical protein